MLGRLSDHMGRRPLLLVSQVGTFIGFLILAYAQRAVADFSFARHRRNHGRQFVAGAGLHLRCDQAGRPRKIVRADRNRLWHGIPDRPRPLRLSFEIRLSIPDLSGGGAFRHQHCGHLLSVAGSYSRRGRQRHSAQVHVTRLGKLRPLLSRAGPGAAAVAILRVHLCLLDVHVGVSRCSPKGVTPGTVRLSDRNRWAMFMRFLGLLGVILQGGLIGRLVKALGETNLARAGFFLRVGRVGGARVHALHSAAADGGGSGIVGNGNHSPHGNQHDHAEGGTVRARRDSGPDAIAQLDFGDRGAGAGGFLDRSFAIIDLGGGGRCDLRNRAAVLVLFFPRRCLRKRFAFRSWDASRTVRWVLKERRRELTRWCGYEAARRRGSRITKPRSVPAC